VKVVSTDEIPLVEELPIEDMCAEERDTHVVTSLRNYSQAENRRERLARRGAARVRHVGSPTGGRRYWRRKNRHRLGDISRHASLFKSHRGLPLPIAGTCLAVWISPGTEMIEIRRILCPIDFSGSITAKTFVSSLADSLLSPDVMSAVARRSIWDGGANASSGRVTACLRGIRTFGRRLLCGLLGHEMLRRFEPDRMCLECARCGAQTAGWTIDVNPAFRRTTPVVTRSPQPVPDAPTRWHERKRGSSPAKAA
jgi:hypothetical protein